MKSEGRLAKSRGGCKNCKERKIKCDEALPVCQTCRRGGVACSGYKRPLRWSRKHETQGSMNSASTIRNGQRTGQQYQPVLDVFPQNEHLDNFAIFSEPCPSFSTWMNLDLTESDARSAYEDAASLLGQDFSGATPSLPDFIPLSNQDASSEAYGSTPTPESLGIESLSANDSSSRAAADTAKISHTSQQVQHQGASDTSTKQGKTGSLALLHIFYRLSSPARYPPGLSDHDFVGYYFKHVSRLISCFDSQVNVFQTLVANHWSTSRTVSFTIQSMAIAHISNWYPYMAPLGVAKRNQAWRSLQRDLQLLRTGCFDLETVLLSLTLLGISASWGNGNNLGLQYLYLARDLIIRDKLQWTAIEPKATVEDIDDFWADALVYWEMLASFVDPIPIITFDGHGLPRLDNELAKQRPITPHPWTGVVTELYFALAEISRVWRRQRKSSTNINSEQDLTSRELDRRWLENLEQYLLATQIPDANSIQDYGDPNTSKLHLIRTAEACRGVCLLELYKLCPELFYDRMDEKSTHEQLPFSIPSNGSGSVMEFNPCLVAMAQHCLNLIKDVPLASGASRFQPLLLVACASQLRILSSVNGLDADEEANQQHHNSTQDRYAAEERMLALSRKFPQAPILRAMDTIKETWERLDNGEEAHWIEVMHEKELQTILG